MWQYSRRNFEACFASIKKMLPPPRTVRYRSRKTLARRVDNGGKKKLMRTLMVKVFGGGYLANRERPGRIMGCRKVRGFNWFKIASYEALLLSC